MITDGDRAILSLKTRRHKLAQHDQKENLVASFVLEFCERGSPTCDRLLYLPSSKGSLLINGEEA
ncbi:hypothetical protein LguiB_013853 [Lonicera macranthoides]